MQPGESGKVPLTLSTKNRGGHLKQTVTVYTNAPAEGGTVRLTMEGEVWEPVAVTPRSASFGRLTAEAAQDSSLSQKLKIVNNLEEPATLTDVRCSNQLFQVETTTIKPGREYELNIVLASSPRRGNNSGTIELSTGIKEKPTLSIPVSLYVMADVDVRPERLMLFSDRTAETKRWLIVQNNTKQPVKITDLQASSPALKLSLEETEPGTLFRIAVDVPTEYEPSVEGDQITFRTNCPTAPEVRIPVRGFRRPTPRAPVRAPNPASVAQPRPSRGSPPATQPKPSEGKPEE